MLKKFYIFLLVLIQAGAVIAQPVEKKIIPDRPDFTNSARVVPQGSVQIESGIYFSKWTSDLSDPKLEINDVGIFSTLVRISLSDMFELRAGGEYLMRRFKEGISETNMKGLNALSAGTKFQFLNSDNSFADAAAVAEITLPFGSADFKPEKAEPRIYLSLSHSLFEPLSVTYNGGMQYRSELEENMYFYSVSFGIEISDRIGAFAEHYGLLLKTGTPRYFADAGFTYLQNDNLMVDIAFGREFTMDVNSWFITAGFSIRLPK